VPGYPRSSAVGVPTIHIPACQPRRRRRGRGPHAAPMSTSGFAVYDGMTATGTPVMAALKAASIPLLRTRSSGNPEIYGRNAASRRESYTRERSGGSLMSTDPAAKNVGARPVPVSPLDAAAAAGDPIEWPKDPENDPPDTPVVVLAVQDDESTYQPFPDSRLEPRPGLIASLQRTGSRRPDRAHPGRPPTCPTRRSAGRRSHVRTGNGPSTGMARRAARGARNARPLVPPGCAAPAACFALCVRDARTLASGYFFSQPGFRGLPQPVTTMSVRSQQAHWAAKPSDAFTAPR
jgi:hypothetical protein